MVNAMTSLPQSTDALILGGGPAGLSAAIALRQNGIDCMVVDALQPTIDKGCGEGLMPDALEALQQLGITITEEDGHPFRGIRFQNASHQTDAAFPDKPGIGVRRTHLHRRMITRAQQLKIPLLWGASAKLLDNSTAVVGGQQIRCRLLVGADGQASSTRRLAGLNEVFKENLRFAVRRHYKVEPWSEYVEVHWGAAGQVYVTPVAKDCVCVIRISRDPKVNRENLFKEFPEMERRLRHSLVVSQPRGAVSVTRRLRNVVSGPVALIGDASGSADAITGEGLAMSFRQAIALAAAVKRNDLRSYTTAHRSIGKLPHAMGSLMLVLDRWPAMQKRALKTLSQNPDLFGELLSVHLGAETLPRFAVRRGPRLGWSLLTQCQ